MILHDLAQEINVRKLANVEQPTWHHPSKGTVHLQRFHCTAWCSIKQFPKMAWSRCSLLRSRRLTAFQRSYCRRSVAFL